MVLSRYRVTSRLGAGGMGEVFAAEDTRLERPVALKFCLTPGDGDGSLRRYLEREARAASQLNHPNIATIYDYEEDEAGRPFLVMELLEGQTLAERMRAGTVAPQEAVRIGASVASALEEAHKHGLLHRDIKPSNIFLTGSGQVKVLDFGLACRYEAAGAAAGVDETRTLLVRGTPAYMSPEQACGDPLDARSDLFSLGAVLYECLTGEKPFACATPTATLRQVLHHAPRELEARSGVPAEVPALVMQMLEKSPLHRPATASEVRETLERTSTAGRPAPVWAWWRWAAACGLAAAAILLGLWLPDLLRRESLPAEARRYYEDGVRALQDGTYLRARKLLEEALNKAPNYAPARARLAQAWLECDNVEKARQQALMAAPAGDRLNRLGPEERHTVAAIQYLVADRFTESEREFALVVKSAQGQKLGQAWYDLGVVKERAQKQKEAAEAYESALKADSTMAAAQLRLGVMAARASRYEDAGKRLAEAARLYGASNNLEGEAEVSCQLARVAVRRERWKEANEHIDRALELAGITGNLQQTVTALSQRVNVLRQTNRFDEARAAAKDSLERAEKAGVSILMARALADLGGVYVAEKNHDEAETHLKKAADLAANAGDRRTEIRAIANLASTYYQKGRCEETVALAGQAAAYYKAQRMAIEGTLMQSLLARCKTDSGALEDAYAAFAEQRETALGAKNSRQVAVAVHGMAMVREYQGRWRESEAKYAESAEAARAAGDPAAEALALCGQSRVLRSLGYWRQAADTAQRAVETGRRVKHENSTASALVEAAAANADGGRLAQAREQMRQAREALARLKPNSTDNGLGAAEERLADRSGEPMRAAGQCLAALGALREATVQWASYKLRCGLYLEHAGKDGEAARIGEELAGLFEKQGRPEALWMALALAELPPQGAGKRAAAAFREYMASLEPKDAVEYRRTPDVARLSKRLAK